MIKKPAEMINETNKFRVLIAGYPGIGKTTLGLSAPNPLLIDVDFGINRVMASARKDYIQPNTYAELLNDLEGDLSDYETIVIDTGGKLLELMKAYVIKNDIKNAKKDGTLSLQGYGAVGREFTRFMNYIYFELRKHCVIIFHAVEEKQDEETKLRILVEGSTKNTVWQNVELGGFIEMRGNKKTIGFDNCERYFAKKSYIQKNEQTIQDFTNAIYKGQKWVKEHTSKEIAETIQNFFPGTDLNLLETAIQSYKDIDAWNENPILKENSFNKLQDVMSLAGELEKKAPYDKIINNKYAEEAIK